MDDVTQILAQIESGDPTAPDKLLPLVYEELRKLAAVRMTRARPGQTLQATALVHEAYVRLLGTPSLVGVQEASKKRTTELRSTLPRSSLFDGLSCGPCR